VDELDGDEVVAGQLEHGQVPDPGLGDGADHLVADGRVERDRPLPIGHPEADVQGPHPVPPAAMLIGPALPGRER